MTPTVCWPASLDVRRDRVGTAYFAKAAVITVRMGTREQKIAIHAFQTQSAVVAIIRQVVAILEKGEAWRHD